MSSRLQSPSLEGGEGAVVVAVGTEATVEVVVVELYALQVLEHRDVAFVHGLLEQCRVVGLVEGTAIEHGGVMQALDTGKRIPAAMLQPR